MLASPAPEQDPLLAPLSDSQRQAVLATEGPVLLLAGAGSGKTRVITHRIATLIQRRGVQPWKILAVTFTNKAAREMLARVGDLLGAEPPRNLWIMTFHALGARLLRLHAAEAGLDPGFTIFDDGDSERLVKRILKKMGIDPARLSPGGAQNSISLLKSHLASPGTDWHRGGAGRLGRLMERSLERGEAGPDLLGEVFDAYERELREQNAVDFADLIARTVRLLREKDEVRRRYQERFQHLLVDEYQDTDHSQYTMMKLLAGPGAALCAVGDEDQSIYSWRGADIGNILSFKSDFPAARVLLLDRNYRCPRPVLEAANAMILNNASRLKEREVTSDKPSRFKPAFHETEGPDDEGELIAQAISWMRMEEGFEYADQAVFYRTHFQARSIEQALMRRGIPYRIFGGLKFYERKAIKDLVCYLRLLVNPADREALLRIVNVPKRGIGDKGVEKLLAAAGTRPLVEVLDDPKVLGGKAGLAGHGLAELVRELRDVADRETLAGVLRHLTMRLDYHEYLAADDRAQDWELVQELDAGLDEYAAKALPETSTLEKLRGFLEEASLVSPVDGLGDGTGTVSLMTLHNAKGLEFPVVFIGGLEEGLLPHENSMRDPASIEEERRLLYVGMTRTKSRLFLSRARSRMVKGGWLQRMPSRFLGEIGAARLQLAGED